jgi:tetratricopeptide (TPR) repeat protein
MGKFTDFYEILGVPFSATSNEIKEKFLSIKKSLAPKKSDSPDSEDISSQVVVPPDILKAYSGLMFKRQSYDQQFLDNLKIAAVEIKNKGIKAYIDENWKEALQYLSEGIQLLLTKDFKSVHSTLLSSLYANRSLAFGQLEDWASGKSDAELSIKNDPRNIKARHNLIRILVKLRLFDEAEAGMKDAVMKFPKNEEISDLEIELHNILKKVRSEVDTPREVVFNPPAILVKDSPFIGANQSTDRLKQYGEIRSPSLDHTKIEEEEEDIKLIENPRLKIQQFVRTTKFAPPEKPPHPPKFKNAPRPSKYRSA